MGDKFDLKLIPEFDGSTPVLDWVEKVELHCLLSGVESIERVIPLRLSGGAFAVYQQLSVEDKKEFGQTALGCELGQVTNEIYFFCVSFKVEKERTEKEDSRV